ncbi:signal recognition particle-docking protein FtsY [Hydromonas duriensis]|uniref:Signal recognition particle receptor FtsY n=1 Tax=Hydromonas duriensis TaxID=1527608 RepID=A0A4R6Y7E3_9BURK|nr:signal recognition particle-docking protein FtsY [Hydromonas duriensis]TDR31251.1 signal recognition particle-docking protein FtsY [Hydromonas duriensis]
MFNFFRRKKTLEDSIKSTPETVENIDNLSTTEPPTTTETAVQSTPLAALSTQTNPTITSPSSPTDSEQPTEATPTTAESSGWLTRLKKGLSKTSSNIKHVFVGHKVDEALFEQLEEALLLADVGVPATMRILEAVRVRVKKERIEDAQDVKSVVKEELIRILEPLEKVLDVDTHKPLVLMVTGVNGAGKTTSIGKLTHHLQHIGKTIILAAGDTFRAAAREQLAVWGERNGVTVIAQESGDPAAVVFDAISSAQAKGIDVVIADTAGRLPTQLHLMDELKKVKRVANKALDGAPHEVLLVIDGSMGQNALAQVKAFDDAVGLTGLIVTKLDGSAKGGVLAALAIDRVIPVYFIGVGESVNDLQTFDAREFVDALLDE